MTNQKSTSKDDSFPSNAEDNFMDDDLKHFFEEEETLEEASAEANHNVTTNNNDHDERKPSNLSLAVADDTGASFEELMKERTRIRKEREEYSVAELRVRVTKLEQALAAQVKRRVDSLHQLELKSQEQIYNMEQRLADLVKEQTQTTSARIESLEQRLQELECKFEEESETQAISVAYTTKEFQEMLHDLQHSVDVEKKQRLVREGRFLQQLESHQQLTKSTLQEETKTRQDEIQKLEQNLENSKTEHTTQTLLWQTKIQSELQKLELELKDEVSQRQDQDEEIVQALNRYTKQLQHSLSILSDGE